MSLTNFEKWRSYMSGFVSPDNYIDFGFYYLISAALQRRVWTGPDHSRLYPNLYIVLVGEPGIGKGLVVKQVAEFLRHHKLPEPSASKKHEAKAITEVDKEMMEEVLKQDYARARAAEGSSGGKDEKEKSYEKPLLFPVAADATTYEALTAAIAKSLRRINYKEFDASVNKEIMKIYTHSSLCFCLEEISSLFRKHSEDLVHFLIVTYDCGDYTKDTKTQGKDRIKKCCLNFFGGTTPAFMQKTFDDELINEGFASRTFFIFASQNRKNSLFIPDLSPEQQQYKKDLLDHIEKLSTLYGKVTIDKDTERWLENWWDNAQFTRANLSFRMNPYYARKNIHLFKMAMAVHFGESYEMHIPKWCFEKALDILSDEERKMHFALGLDSGNPLAGPAKNIVSFLTASGKKTKKEILAEFWESVPNGEQSIEDILNFLMAMGTVKQISEMCPKTQVEKIYYTTFMRERRNNGHS
jgi:hypothetical protein